MAKDQKYFKLYHEIKKRLKQEHPVKIKENGKIRWNNAHIDAIAKNRIETEIAKELWYIYHND